MTTNLDHTPRDPVAPLRFLVVAACVVVLVAGLRAASSVIEPFLIALFVVTLSLPVLFWLKQRMPTMLAVVGTILLDIAVLAAAASLIGTTVNQLGDDMDNYQDRLGNLIDSGAKWLEARDLQPEWLAVPAGDEAGLLERLDSSLLFDFANQALLYTATAFSSMLIIALIVVFMLFEAATFRAKVRVAFGGPGSEERFSRIAHEIQHYIGIKTVLSAATGLLIGVWCAVLGVDFAIFWGLVAFVLNFIPNLGSIIAAVPTTLLAMVQIGVGTGLLVALGYLIVNMVIGNFIEPHLMGRRLGLSTLVVVLSLVFWGWVWGPIGMLLSVPLTMILKIMLENTEEFRWVAVLLGDSRAAERMAPVSDGDGDE